MGDILSIQLEDTLIHPSELPRNAVEFRDYWAERFARYGHLIPADADWRDVFGHFTPVQNTEHVVAVVNALQTHDRDFIPHHNIRTPLEEARALEQANPEAYLQALVTMIPLLSQTPLDGKSGVNIWTVAQRAEEAHLGDIDGRNPQLHAAINSVASYIYEIGMGQDLPYALSVADRFLTTTTGRLLQYRFNYLDITERYRAMLEMENILDHHLWETGGVAVVGSFKSAYSIMRRVLAEDDIFTSLASVSKNLHLEHLAENIISVKVLSWREKSRIAAWVFNALMEESYKGEIPENGYVEITKLITAIEDRMARRNDVFRGRLFCNTVSASEVLIDRIVEKQRAMRNLGFTHNDPRFDAFVLDVEDELYKPQVRNMVHTYGFAESFLAPYGKTITAAMLQRLWSRKGDISMWLAFHGYFPAQRTNGSIEIMKTLQHTIPFGMEMQVFTPGGFVNDAHRSTFTNRDDYRDYERLLGVIAMQLERAQIRARQAQKEH